MSMRDTAQRWKISRDQSGSTRARSGLISREQAVEEQRERDMVGLVHSAWEDWQAAQNYFEAVSDPELIDYAIYSVEAARRKYIYLLRKAEEAEAIEAVGPLA